MRFLNESLIELIRERFGTPVYVYDQRELEAAADRVLAFPAPGRFVGRFAMKALPTAAVLRILDARGLHVDASSGFEAERALRAGIAPEKIQITAQELPRDLKGLVQRGVLFNACSLHQLRTYGELFPGRAVSVRINPGLGSGHNNRTNVGGPSSSFGIWHEKLDEVIAIARDLVEWSGERGKDDLERKSGYRDRDRDRVFSRLEGLVRDHDADVDVELLASFLRYADALPGKRIAGFDKIMGAAKGAGADNLDAYREAARAALEGSALADPEGMKALFEDPAAVAASKDPMIVLARALVGELAELEEIKLAEQGAMVKLGPAYFGLLAGLRPQPVYADANSTLRMSYASIKGYAKWNGEEQKPQTVMGGAVAKNVGSGDFNLPAKVLEKAKTAPQSRWADPRLGDLPLCFLADGDTTGGNSGSPVIDGKGQLIGFNFDRVWENVAGDYAWRTEQSRNVVADVRYLYWMLEEVAEAPHLLQELGVADYQPPAQAPMTEVKDDVPPPAPGQEKKSGCNCSTGDDEGGGGSLGLLALLALTGAGLRRRSRL